MLYLRLYGRIPESQGGLGWKGFKAISFMGRDTFHEPAGPKALRCRATHLFPINTSMYFHLNTFSHKDASNYFHFSHLTRFSSNPSPIPVKSFHLHPPREASPDLLLHSATPILLFPGSIPARGALPHLRAVPPIPV